MRRSVLTAATCFALLLGVITPAAGQPAAPAAPQGADPAAGHRTVERSSSSLPAVYPTPQSIATAGSGFQLRARATLVVGEDSDAAAVAQVERLLSDAGVTRVSTIGDDEPLPRGVPTFVVGGPDVNAATAGALQELDADGPAELAADGYVLAAGKARGRQLVVLAGKDATGTFYAAQTLRQLISTTSRGHAAVPGVQVRDWPSLPVRGVIEGFYGTPWSHEQRLRQLDFYGDHKMNKYVYSPKDDPYLRARWREPYPAEQLAALAELVQRADANHVEFTYALSPGLSVCYSSPADEQALVDKFQSLWDIGVRSFAVPLDDISYTDWNCDADEARWGTGGEAAGHAQAHLLNQVRQNFIATHPGAQRLEMVPTEYYTVTPSPYTEALSADLDDSIVVEWTGVGVVPATITREQAAAANKTFGHDILIWDNYPVNDYATSRLLLGPYTGREADLPVYGITANPMIQPEASKLALFGVADYTWNDTAYDADRTWQAAITELAGGNEQVRAALAAFADLEYTSVLDSTQAPVLADKVRRFWTNWGARDEHAGAALEDYLTVIGSARQVLTDQMNNPSFVADAAPWLTAAELWATSGQAALRMLYAQRAGDGASALDARAEAVDAMAAAQDVVYHGLAGDSPVLVGDGVLDTFITQALSANGRWLGTSGEKITASASLSTYQSHRPQNMVDGDTSTFFWSSEAARPGDTVEVDLAVAQDISTAQVLMGKSGSENDYIHAGVLEYSTDGQNWTEIGSYSGQSEISVELPEPVTARYVRLRATESQSNWVVVREFDVAGPDTGVGTVTGGPAPTDGSSLAAAADGDPDTAYLAAVAPTAGEAMVLTLNRPRPLDHVVIAGRGTAKVQVGSDGDWQDIGELSDSGYTELNAGGATAAAIRLLWDEGSPAPRIAEIVPWYDDVPAADIGVTPAVLDGTVGANTVLTLNLSGTRITDKAGRWEVQVPARVRARPSWQQVTVHRGEQRSATVLLTSAHPGEYPVTARFVPQDGEPVSTTATLRVHPPVTEQNIALADAGATATASSTEQDLPQFTPDHAIDGDTSTRWSSAHTDDQWLQVALAEPADVGKVVLRWESAFGKSFAIQTSPDGENWTTAATVTDGLGGVQTLWLDQQGVQYLRMQGTARGTAYGYSLYEFEVYPLA